MTRVVENPEDISAYQSTLPRYQGINISILDVKSTWSGQQVQSHRPQPCQLIHQQNARHIIDHPYSACSPAHAGTAQQHLQRGQLSLRINADRYASFTVTLCELAGQVWVVSLFATQKLQDKAKRPCKSVLCSIWHEIMGGFTCIDFTFVISNMFGVTWVDLGNCKLDELKTTAWTAN
jgi:hypothetical protein